LESDLAAKGFLCFTLDGSKMGDERSFIRELVQSLPCDPDYFEVGSDREPNWDAVEDALWGGLGNFAKRSIAIFWRAADRLLERHLNLVLEAVCILMVVGYAHHLGIKVFLFGQGENFISLGSEGEDAVCLI
jgi:hypothetical protein